MGQPWDNRGTTETSFDENFARALRKSKNQMMYEKLDSQDSSFLHVSTDSCPSCCAFFNLFQSFPWLCCFANVFQRLSTSPSPSLYAGCHGHRHGQRLLPRSGRLCRCRPSHEVRRAAHCLNSGWGCPGVTDTTGHPGHQVRCWDWCQYVSICVNISNLGHPQKLPQVISVNQAQKLIHHVSV